MKKFYKASILALGGAMGLAGCDNTADTNKVTSALPSNAVAPATAADSLGPRYKASLEDGIDFKKQGYPSFLVDVHCLSIYEAWGNLFWH